MATPECLEILQHGATEWNQWREDNSEVDLDFSEVDFRRLELEGDNLDGFDFSGAKFYRSNLSGMKLMEADLRDAIFVEVDMSKANLTGAAFRNSELRGVDLSAAHLYRTDFTQADMRQTVLRDSFLQGGIFNSTRLNHVHFDDSQMGWTIFADVDLRTAYGLHEVMHLGPSTIGLDTIYASKGEISKVFLRGCGVPDEVITYMPSLVGDPVEYYSCFISYSGKDQELADRLHADLQSQGVRCWYAQKEIKAGQKIHEQIDRAIQRHDRLLLLLSEHSMNSEWVKTEIYKARQREVKENRRILFPLSVVPFEIISKWEFFDGDSGKDLAREIRTYYIPDFSKWKDHDIFKQEFAKLLRDLKVY